MTLSEIATVTGKGGLFKVLAPTKSGVILESLDDTKTKMIATSSHKLSLLHEISIYTTTKEGTVPLLQVLRKIKTEYKDDLGVDSNSDTSELKAFLKSILPEFDENRVYASDIKKLVKWYDVLSKYAPEIFDASNDKKAEEKKTEAEPVAETKEEPVPATDGKKKTKKKAE